MNTKETKGTKVEAKDENAIARERHNDLKEAAKLIGVDAGNSCELVAHAIEMNRPADVRDGLKLLRDRLASGEALLAKHGVGVEVKG